MFERSLRALALLLASAPLITSIVRAQTVLPDPSVVEVPHWEGWGCGLSWWGVFSGGWPDARRREVCRRLFSHDADSLGLSVVRYNAGGTAPEADPKLFRPGGKVQVILDRDGSWHPERDRGQIDCLKLSRRFGADTGELFVNSPPWWMLKNANTRGGDKGDYNLAPEHEKDFADWVDAVTARLQKTSGVSFDWVEPFNEPSAWWWDGARSSQEGCKISWPAQAHVLSALKHAIDRNHRSYKIACSDENGAHEAYNTLEWLTKPDDGKGGGGGLDARTIAKLNVHSYHGWEWQERLRDLAAQCGIRRTWMSEVSHREWENAGFIPDDMRCALPLSRAIISDVKGLRCSAWVYWQAVEPLEYCLRYHYTYGLLPAAAETVADWNGRTYHPGEYVAAKSFYAFMQFTRFIRPGSRLIATGNDWTLASLSPDGQRLTLVVSNDTPEVKPYSFDLSRLTHLPASAAVWRTKDNDASGAWNCRHTNDLPLQNGRFTDPIPARSVTTYVVSIGRARAAQHVSP